MTEKRFELAYETNEQNCIWWAIRDGDVTLWKEEVADQLNALHEENEYLKHELLCKQLDKAPTEPINCKCHYEVKE